MGQGKLVNGTDGQVALDSPPRAEVPTTATATCEYEEMLCEQPASKKPIKLDASPSEARAAYGDRSDGKRHANRDVVDQLILAERAWACACASSLHLVQACKQQDETVLCRRWAMHLEGAGGHNHTAAMLIKAASEAALDGKAWAFINELNSLAAKPFHVPRPLASPCPGNIIVAIRPTETVADVLSKLELATGVPAARAALTFTPVLPIGATDEEELQPCVLSSDDTGHEDKGAPRLISFAGVDNGDTLQLGTAPPVAGRSAVIHLPSELHGTFGERLVVAVKEKDTIRTLKARVQALTSVPLGDQLLQYGYLADAEPRKDTCPNETQLIWPDATEDEFSHQISMRLALRKGVSAPATPYTISIAIPPPPFHVRVPVGTVEQIKEHLQAATGLEPSKQVLVAQCHASRPVGGAGGGSTKGGGGGGTKGGSADGGGGAGDRGGDGDGGSDAGNSASGGDSQMDGLASLGDAVQLTSTPMSETVTVSLPQLLCATYGPTMSIAAASTDTLSDVKHKLALLLRVPPPAQALSLGGTLLVDDDASLGALGVLDTEGKQTGVPYLLHCAPCTLHLAAYSLYLTSCRGNRRERGWHSS